MTENEARNLIRGGHASRSTLAAHGWQIAHPIAGELEWFSVSEEDAAVLERLVRAMGSRSPERRS